MSEDPTRDAFEAWFVATYGPPPTDDELLANLHEAARIEAFMGGAWAAWQHCRAVQAIIAEAQAGTVTLDAARTRLDEISGKVAAVLAEKYGTEPTT